MPRLILFLPLLLGMSGSDARLILLDQGAFEHIHFRRIQPSRVTFNDNTLRFSVNKSASFLLLTFDQIETVRKVSFEWQAEGMLNKTSVAQEKTRAGDDAWLRIGLIISGQPEQVPDILLPRWMQQIKKALKHPSDRMIYLIPDARHAPGETWPSPFSASIDMISVQSRAGKDGWQQASYEFAAPQRTVGLWLMADGDNTDSIFSSQLRHLVIE